MGKFGPDECRGYTPIQMFQEHIGTGPLTLGKASLFQYQFVSLSRD